MSGGVDSSVTAALLAEAGHDVIGVTLQLYDHGAATAKKGACCAGQDIHDARNVADCLGIPHYVIDAEARFRESVIEPFAAAYASGETPVPCIACNQGVKFNDLLGLARDLGAEALATGHYVRREEGPAGPELHRAADPDRDQSWFLFATTRAQLEFCRFPLGHMPDKNSVRAHAARFDLPVAEKPDSQDICFVPRGSYADLVARLRPDAAAPGEIVTQDGTKLGPHAGIARFTVGQSKRLGAAALHKGQRMAVVSLDAATRRVVVGPRETGATRISLRNVNWLADPVSEGLNCTVRLRARDVLRSAHVKPSGPDTDIMSAEVTLAMPALPAPGQACVFYDGTRILGGGFIRAGYENGAESVAPRAC
jgi:tRNA-specific 2-thiouridylase